MVHGMVVCFLLVLVVGASACRLANDDPQRTPAGPMVGTLPSPSPKSASTTTPTTLHTNTPAAEPAGSSVPTSASIPTPSTAAALPTRTAMPLATSSVTSTSSPVPSNPSSPTRTVTATPLPVSADTPSPTPTITPSPTVMPTAREVARGQIADVIESPPDTYARIADLLIDLWLLDVDLGTMAAALPWAKRDYTDGSGTRRNIYFERFALETLHRIGSRDIDLARLVAGFPWFVDGMSHFEVELPLPALRDLTSKDAALARRIASLPWYADDSLDTWSKAVGSTVQSINRIAASDITLAREITEFSWFDDGITHDEWVAILDLSQLADSDIELAGEIVGLWRRFDDGGARAPGFVRGLGRLTALDMELARQTSEHSWFSAQDTVSSHVLTSLSHLATIGKDVLGELKGQPWFADGLDKEEATLVATLGWAARESSDLYADLLRIHYTQYRTISLPMAGNVNIWVFQNTPFPPEEDLLSVIENTARISERLMGIPFPTTDIILLVVDDADRRYRISRGAHLGSSCISLAARVACRALFMKRPTITLETDRSGFLKEVLSLSLPT